MNAAPDGSVIQREAPRPDLVAFEIRDKITKPDIEWMSALTDRAMQAHGTIDMLLIMANYEGSELGATFDGYATSVKVRSVAHIRYYVVVGAPAFAEAMIKLSGVVLPVEVNSRWYNKNEWTLKAVSASAVRGTDGVVHMGLTNVDPNRPTTVTVKLDGVTGANVTGRIVTAAAMDAHNTFDRPDVVRPAAFTGTTLSAGTLTVTLPAKSVVMLDIK